MFFRAEWLLVLLQEELHRLETLPPSSEVCRLYAPVTFSLTLFDARVYPILCFRFELSMCMRLSESFPKQ